MGQARGVKGGDKKKSLDRNLSKDESINRGEASEKGSQKGSVEKTFNSRKATQRV